MIKMLLGGVSVLLLTVAHIIRAYRWGLFISVYEKQERGRLIQAISIGYLANYIVPYKLGDLVRAWYASRRMITGKALALSTVIVDRILDIVVVGTIFLALTAIGSVDVQSEVGFYVLAAIGVLLCCILAYGFKSYIKKAIVLFARLFNTHLEGSVLRFSFSLISDFKNILHRISVVKLVVSTVTMWVMYIASYYTFSLFASYQSGEGLTWVDLFEMLFSQGSVISSTGRISLFWEKGVIVPTDMFIFMFVPLVLLWFISFFFKNEGNAYEDKDNHFINLLPHMDLDERLAFLENYFSNNNRQYIESYLELNRNIAIIRDYSAGSNATTMLCMDGNSTFFRKYAFGKDGEKLYEQIKWIEENTGIIPLPQILRQGKTEVYCYYDMPYESHSVGLFEYVHSMPVDSGWKMIRQALECMENTLYKTRIRRADKQTLEKYISDKVERNLEKIRKAKYISDLQKYDKVIINGVEYNNLKVYDRYLRSDYLKEIFKNDDYSVIHGDLTIENIICTRGDDGKDDFYIIDPNTGNIHDSPNLDYGKLLQSIHGGYEFLMSTKDISVRGNRIDFLFTRSSAYRDLHGKLKEYMLEHFGKDRTRSIYFHEVVHWLRLMPYKIDKDGKRAILFYAGMLMVMSDVIKMYGEPYEGK